MLSAGIRIDQGDYDAAGNLLEQVRTRAGRHSLRDLEAKALCLLGKVRAEQGMYEDAIELCSEGTDLTRRLGHSAYECLIICADIYLAVGDKAGALDLLEPALDEAVTVYREKCPPKMVHGFMESKRIPEYVTRIEHLLTELGRAEEAGAYRTRFPLK